MAKQRSTTELLAGDAWHCPLCGYDKVVPGLECARCARWWVAYGLRTSAAPRVEPGELIATMWHKLRLKRGTPFRMLDVGGGSGTAGLDFWKKYGLSHLTVVDRFNYTATPHAQEFVCADGCDVASLFAPRSFDVVIATETIEHLPKERGPEFLTALEAVADEMVIVVCPNGYTHQDPETVPPAETWRENPYQKHLCGWTLDEFLRLGWRGHANGLREDGAVSAFQVIAYKSLDPRR